MATLHIELDGEGKFSQLAQRKVHHVQTFTITGLEGGTSGGLPSVAVIAEIQDGSWVFAETTLRLFLTAADALKAKYGDPRAEPEPE